MRIYVPLWIFYVSGAALWLYGAYASLMFQALAGKRYRLIWAFTRAALWPVEFTASLATAIFRRPE